MSTGEDRFDITFWGIRGSIPTPGPDTVKYGGNTICVEVRCGDELIIIDCGSGVRVLGQALLESLPIRATILFTHFHWDHIQGYPFFTPAFVEGNHFDIYGESKLNNSVKKVLAGQMLHPNFPVPLSEMSAAMNFHELKPGDALHLPGGVEVKTVDLNHPGNALSYRIEYNGRVLVTGWDTEHSRSGVDDHLVRHAEGADCLIYDATYDDDDYYGRRGGPNREGWGHSTWQEGVKLATSAGVRQLLYIHPDPTYTDRRLGEIDRLSQAAFPNSQFAREGMTVSL